MKWISAIKENLYVAVTIITQTLQIRKPLCKTGFIGAYWPGEKKRTDSKELNR